MTAIASTGPLRSSGLPLTQNTAPVLDFRCLYTHDLRQKKKRWHDGVLRFHTFNSRIMVYDVSRNFIGDKYWREPEIIQDGVELELEKGVLIQVEEATGRTEQDLSPILNHHKTSPNNRPTAPPARAHSTSTAVFSATSAAVSRENATLLKPKSLNAVLGTPRGKHGRALLPEKSPFQSRREQRSSSVIIENDCKQIERPAKRLKTAKNGLGKKTAVQLAREAACGSRQKVDSAMHPRGQQAQNDASSHKQPIPITRSVINLDTDVEDTEASATQYVSPRSPKLPREKNASKTRNNVMQIRAADTLVAQQASPKKQQKDSGEDHQISKNTPREVPTTAHKVPQDKNLPPEDDSIPVAHERSPPPYTLRFAATKPRRKLMYRDLLPDQPPSKRASSASRITSNRPLTSSSNDLVGVEQVQKQPSADPARNQQSSPPNDEVKESHSDVTRARSMSKSHPSIVERSDRVISPEARSKKQDQQGHGDGRPMLVQDPWDMDMNDLDDLDRMDVSKRTGLFPSDGGAPGPLNASRLTLLNVSLPTARQIHNQLTAIHHAQPEDTNPSKFGPIPEPGVPPKDPQSPSLQNQDVLAADHALQVSRRSPIKKIHSENNTSSTKSITTKVPTTFKRHTSDMSNTRTTRSALSTIRDRAFGATAVTTPLTPREDTVTDPWSREAFDLFGWRPGDSKAIISKVANTRR